jgi:PAS domain-containing protein
MDEDTCAEERKMRQKNVKLGQHRYNSISSQGLAGCLEGQSFSLEETHRSFSNNFRRMAYQGETKLVYRSYPYGAPIFINDAFCIYPGANREELIGQSILSLSPLSEIANEHPPTLPTENTWAAYECGALTSGGKEAWLQWIARMIFGSIGELIEASRREEKSLN